MAETRYFLQILSQMERQQQQLNNVDASYRLNDTLD